MPVLPGHHQPDNQRNPERQQYADQPCCRPQHQLQFIFRRQRCQQVLQDPDAGRNPDRDAQHRQPKILTDQQPSDLRILESDHLQRRHLPVPLRVAHHAQVVQHNDPQDHRRDHQQPDHLVHQVHERVKGIHDALFALLVQDVPVVRDLRLIRKNAGNFIGNARPVREGVGHEDAFRHAVQHPRHRNRIMFIAVVGGERQGVPGLQAVIPRDPRADINAFVCKRNDLHVRVREPHLVVGNRVDLQGISLVPDLDRRRSRPVALQGFRQRFPFLQGHILFVQIHPGGIVDRFLIENVQESIHRVLHAQSADQQHHATDDPEQRHQAPRLMPHAVPKVPFRPEPEPFEPFCFFKVQMRHPLWRVRPQSVCRCSLQHPANGKEPDKRQESDDPEDHDPGKSGRMQRPAGNVDIRRHGPVRVHNEIPQPVADPDPEHRPQQPDDQRVGAVMPQDPPVLKPQCLQRADLRLLAGADPMHRRHHRQDRDGQEQYRQNPRHRFSFVHLAHGLRPGNRFIL